MKFSNYIFELNKPKAVDKARAELSGVKSVDTRNSSWMKSITSIMADNGFKRVGSGKYASVFLHSKYPYALKIFMKDSAYLRWIDFAKKNQKNPFVPKIRGKVVKITPVIYAIRLEKLDRYSYGGGKKFMSEYARWAKDKNYKSSDPDIQAVLEEFAKNKSLLDLHGENMMMRGNQLVIIDPYYNWFGRKEPGKYMIDPDDIPSHLF